MQSFAVRVFVKLKSGILDPQGQAITHALHALGFENIAGIHAGKLFELEILSETEEKAKATAERACTKLLANPNIETFSLELLDKSKNRVA